MGKSSKPSFSTGTVLVNGQTKASTYKKGNNIVSNYNMSDAEKQAYDYAQSTNQTYTSVDNPDLVYFSSGDYINTIVENGNYMPEAAYTYTYRHVSGFRNELEYLKSCESNALTFDSVPDVMMDSVYIKSLDAFCTVNQFNTYLENGVLVKNEDGTISLGEI